MRAAVFRQGKILVDTVSDPKPSEGQVLVRTCACGICGSDLHAAKHTSQFVNLAKRAGNRWAMDADRDVVFGHEFCCEILEYGPRTPARLAPGTLVCSMPMTLADKMVQGIGYSNEIAGGFAEFMPLADKLLLPVPNGLPAEQAALTEPIAVGWHAVQNARLASDDLPMVVGCGPVGLAVIAGLAIRDVHPIIAVDFSPARRELALKMGADIVIDPAVASPYDAWRRTVPRGLRRQPLRATLWIGTEAAPGGDLRMRRRARCHPADHGGGTTVSPSGRRWHLYWRPTGLEPFFGIVKQLQRAVRAGLYRAGIQRKPALHRRGEDRRHTADHRHGRSRGGKRRLRRTRNPERHAKIIVDPRT